MCVCVCVCAVPKALRAEVPDEGKGKRSRSSSVAAGRRGGRRRRNKVVLAAKSRFVLLLRPAPPCVTLPSDFPAMNFLFSDLSVYLRSPPSLSLPLSSVASL